MQMTRSAIIVANATEREHILTKFVRSVICTNEKFVDVIDIDVIIVAALVVELILVVAVGWVGKYVGVILVAAVLPKILGKHVAKLKKKFVNIFFGNK